MILVGCSNVMKLICMSPQTAVPVVMSRVVSMCFPLRGFFLNGLCSLHRPPVRSMTLCSVRLSTESLWSGGSCCKGACRYAASVPRSWSSWPVTMLMQCLRHRSTSAAPAVSTLTPDVFPKRVARRTKKKDSERRSQVNKAWVMPRRSCRTCRLTQ